MVATVGGVNLANQMKFRLWSLLRTTLMAYSCKERRHKYPPPTTSIRMHLMTTASQAAQASLRGQWSPSPPLLPLPRGCRISRPQRRGQHHLQNQDCTRHPLRWRHRRMSLHHKNGLGLLENRLTGTPLDPISTGWLAQESPPPPSPPAPPMQQLRPFPPWSVSFTKLTMHTMGISTLFLDLGFIMMVYPSSIQWLVSRIPSSSLYTW